MIKCVSFPHSSWLPLFIKLAVASVSKCCSCWLQGSWHHSQCQWSRNFSMRENHLRMKHFWFLALPLRASELTDLRVSPRICIFYGYKDCNLRNISVPQIALRKVVLMKKQKRNYMLANTLSNLLWIGRRNYTKTNFPQIQVDFAFLFPFWRLKLLFLLLFSMGLWFFFLPKIIALNKK